MTEPQRFPKPHYPPRKQEGGPDIELMPFPHTLVCPQCGLSRSLPDGWEKILGTDTLTCTECLQVMREPEEEQQ